MHALIKKKAFSNKKISTYFKPKKKVIIPEGKNTVSSELNFDILKTKIITEYSLTYKDKLSGQSYVKQHLKKHAWTRVYVKRRGFHQK